MNKIKESLDFSNETNLNILYDIYINNILKF
jgi:hypothetical protein